MVGMLVNYLADRQIFLLAFLKCVIIVNLTVRKTGFKDDYIVLEQGAKGIDWQTVTGC